MNMYWIKNELNITGYYPNIIHNLSKIDYEKYFFKKYWLQHPYWIYTKKLDKVGKTFLELLSELNKKKRDKEKITNCYVELISKFNWLIEVASEIVLWFHEIERNHKFVHQDLKKNGIAIYSNFYNSIKNDISYFKELNNHFKHASYNIEYLDSESPTFTTIWYFISKVNSEWGIMPDENFHKPWNNKLTWNSFNKELREIYFLIYKLSHQLDHHVVSKFISDEIKIGISKNKEDIYESIYNELEKLDDSYFPNEEKDFVYKIRLRWDYLKINSQIPKRNLERRQFHIWYEWDWHSRIFALLY